jgi:hypothetical protein
MNEAGSKVSSKNQPRKGFILRMDDEAGKPLQSESKLSSRKPI